MLTGISRAGLHKTGGAEVGFLGEGLDRSIMIAI